MEQYPGTSKKNIDSIVKFKIALKAHLFNNLIHSFLCVTHTQYILYLYSVVFFSRALRDMFNYYVLCAIQEL